MLPLMSGISITSMFLQCIHQLFVNSYAALFVSFSAQAVAPKAICRP